MFKMAYHLVVFVVYVVAFVVVGLTVIFGILGVVAEIPGNAAKGAIDAIIGPLKKTPRSKS